MLTGLAALHDPEAEVDGFFIGMYRTDRSSGDAWIWAPDARIAVLAWSTGPRASFAEAAESLPSTRWGNFTVRLPLPLTTDHEAHDYLAALLPELRPRWMAWRSSTT